MPTILLVKGWRFFFYANERDEPYGMSSRDRREVKQIIYEHFETLEAEWARFQRGDQR